MNQEPKRAGSTWLLAVLATLGLSASALAQDDPFAAPADDAPLDAPEEAAPEPEPEPEPAAPEPEREPEPEGPSADLSLSASASAEGGIEGEAEAEAEAPAEEVGGAGDVEEIVVTGSRVKRTTYSLPSSIQVIGREELEMSGATNMADVVKHLSINYGSNFNTDVSTGAGGTAQFNLRGLGLNSTLVLLNGRRLVQSASVATDGNNFTDVNSIPLHMVERIEILKGGASAIYGSDAVAGVVNIITRNSMEGFEVSVGGQTTDDFDQDEWDVALIGGTSMGKTRIHGSVMYFERSPLAATDRDFVADAGGTVSLLGQPGLYVVPADPLQFYRDARCSDAPNSVAVPNSGANVADLANGGEIVSLLDADRNPTAPPYCTFNFGPFFDLVMDEQRTNGWMTVEHDISDHTKVFFEAGYARNRSVRGVSPAFPVLQNLIIPPDHQYNPTGAPLVWRGRPLGAETGRQEQFYESDTLHTVAGIGGDFGGLVTGSLIEDWTWEIAGSWSVNQFYFGLPDSLTQPLQDALNSCGPTDDPAGCFNPFYMSGAPNSQAIIDTITGELRTKADTQLTTVGADLGGPIFELPGGDLGFAIGAQIRHETAQSDADHDANQGNYVFLIGGPDWGAERDIMAAYGELVMPFFEGFELQAAARFEDYEDVGSTVDPKIGMSWTPAETFAGAAASRASKVRLRGTYATSFRAPSLLQTQGAQTELREIFDISPDPMDPAMRARATTGTFRAITTKGSPDLEPETSTAITAGLEWSPVEGLTIDGDYWRYDYEDIIVKENPQDLLDDDFACGVAPALRPEGCNPGIRRDATGQALQIDTEFVNQRSLVADGIDFNVIYRSDFGGSAGTFSFGGGGAYILSFKIPQEATEQSYQDSPDSDCDGEECDVAGNRNFGNFSAPLPALRASFPLGWSMDGHTAGLTVRLIGGYTDDANPEADGTLPDVDSQMTLDLQYALRIDEGDNWATTVKVGVQNLLEADPPSVADNFGYDPLTHDPRGRLLYGRLIQEF